MFVSFLCVQQWPNANTRMLQFILIGTVIVQICASVEAIYTAWRK
jgi:hypothetical protein